MCYYCAMNDAIGVYQYVRGSMDTRRFLKDNFYMFEYLFKNNLSKLLFAWKKRHRNRLGLRICPIKQLIICRVDRIK